jgi:TonB family protein
MRNKLLTYALVASIAAHFVILGVVGRTSAAKPIEIEPLRLVKVDLVKTPEDAAINQDKPDAPKPKVEESESPPEAPYVPPPTKMVVDKNPPKPTPQPYKKPVTSQPHHPQDHRPANSGQTSVSTKLPGNPGSSLSGIGAPNGQDLGNTGEGHTPVGWVPGTGQSSGTGSGEGEGVGTPKPPKNAVPGPGHEPAPEPVAPPPAPRYVTVTVCAESGMLPCTHCQKKESKSFRDGTEPSRQCTECKAPHINRQADRAEPELAKDCQPNIPDLDEPGDYSVKVRYTVNEDGSVSDVEIVKSSGVKAIDRAIVEAAKKMRYKPAVQDGQARSVKANRTYKVSV